MSNSTKYKIIYAILAGLFTITVWLLVSTYKEHSPDMMMTHGFQIPEAFTPDGISIKKFQQEIDGNIVSVSLIEADISKLINGIGIISPETISKHNNMAGYTGLSLKEYAKIEEFRVVQSGGFLSSWSPPYPLGYVKIRGKEYNRHHNSWLTTGVFCTNGRDFSITEFASPSQFEKWISCIQAGPLVIKDSKVVLDTKRNTWFITGDRHRQSFICKKNGGRILMGIAEDVSLKSLADVMRKPENQNGFGCIDAVTLMSKGVSGVLVNTETHQETFGNVDVPLPNAIVIK